MGCPTIQNEIQKIMFPTELPGNLRSAKREFEFLRRREEIKNTHQFFWSDKLEVFEPSYQ